jgi:hypothetical protein
MRPPVLWRSSAPGLDLATFVLPNPNHPLAPSRLVHWFASQPNQFEENVASLPLAGFGILLLAWIRVRYRPDRFWAFITIGFASIAIGPFLVVAGVRTFVPTPWALLRYAPIIGEARMPPRFAVVVLLGFAMLVASALAALADRDIRRRRQWLAAAAILLLFELLPAPRTLYSAEPPSVLREIAADPRPIRVLQLPFGIRDGLSSIGDFSAVAQFYQIFHQKPLIGGYLSRVSGSSKAFYMNMPMMRALARLSAGDVSPGDDLQEARDTAAAFAAQARLAYVLVDEGRARPELTAFAIDAFRLTSEGQDGSLHLYRRTWGPRFRPRNP